MPYALCTVLPLGLTHAILGPDSPSPLWTTSKHILRDSAQKTPSFLKLLKNPPKQEYSFLCTLHKWSDPHSPMDPYPPWLSWQVCVSVFPSQETLESRNRDVFISVFHVYGNGIKNVYWIDGWMDG